MAHSASSLIPSTSSSVSSSHRIIENKNELSENDVSKAWASNAAAMKKMVFETMPLLCEQKGFSLWGFFEKNDKETLEKLTQDVKKIEKLPDNSFVIQAAILIETTYETYSKKNQIDNANNYLDKKYRYGLALMLLLHNLYESKLIEKPKFTETIKDTISEISYRNYNQLIIACTHYYRKEHKKDCLCCKILEGMNNTFKQQKFLLISSSLLEKNDQPAILFNTPLQDLYTILSDEKGSETTKHKAYNIFALHLIMKSQYLYTPNKADIDYIEGLFTLLKEREQSKNLSEWSRYMLIVLYIFHDKKYDKATNLNAPLLENKNLYGYCHSIMLHTLSQNNVDNTYYLKDLIPLSKLPLKVEKNIPMAGWCLSTEFKHSIRNKGSFTIFEKDSIYNGNAESALFGTMQTGEHIEYHQYGAMQNCPYSMYILGKYYCLTKKDVKKGLEYLHQSAALNHYPAMYLLGSLYCNGTGVNNDCKESINYYEKIRPYFQKQAIYLLSHITLNYYNLEKDKIVGESIRYFFHLRNKEKDGKQSDGKYDILSKMNALKKTPYLAYLFFILDEYDYYTGRVSTGYNNATGNLLNTNFIELFDSGLFLRYFLQDTHQNSADWIKSQTYTRFLSLKLNQGCSVIRDEYFLSFSDHDFEQWVKKINDIPHYMQRLKANLGCYRLSISKNNESRLDGIKYLLNLNPYYLTNEENAKVAASRSQRNTGTIDQFISQYEQPSILFQKAKKTIKADNIEKSIEDKPFKEYVRGSDLFEPSISVPSLFGILSEKESNVSKKIAYHMFCIRLDLSRRFNKKTTDSFSFLSTYQGDSIWFKYVKISLKIYEKNYREAQTLIDFLFDAHDPYIYFLQGMIYYHFKNHETAIEWLELASQRGVSIANLILGDLCLDNNKLQEAERYYKTISDYCPMSMYQLAMLASKNNQVNLACDFFEAAIKVGCEHAFIPLADIYYHSKNYQKAFYYYQQANKTNIPGLSCMHRIAEMYLEAKGVEKNFSKAALYLRNSYLKFRSIGETRPMDKEEINIKNSLENLLLKNNPITDLQKLEIEYYIAMISDTEKWFQFFNNHPEDFLKLYLTDLYNVDESTLQVIKKIHNHGSWLLKNLEEKHSVISHQLKAHLGISILANVECLHASKVECNQNDDKNCIMYSLATNNNPLSNLVDGIRYLLNLDPQCLEPEDNVDAGFFLLHYRDRKTTHRALSYEYKLNSPSQTSVTRILNQMIYKHLKAAALHQKLDAIILLKHLVFNTIPIEEKEKMDLKNHFSLTIDLEILKELEEFDAFYQHTMGLKMGLNKAEPVLQLSIGLFSCHDSKSDLTQNHGLEKYQDIFKSKAK